jgi:hypothetical protein
MKKDNVAVQDIEVTESEMKEIVTNWDELI